MYSLFGPASEAYLLNRSSGTVFRESLDLEIRSQHAWSHVVLCCVVVHEPAAAT